MVKLLDDGSFMIPGEERVHASLHALVTFHQQRPMRPHGDLLTQPCGQKDPENVDYEDLFLYSYALTEEVTSPTHGPSKHQNPSSCSTVAPEEGRFRGLAGRMAPGLTCAWFQTSGRPILLHRPKGRRPSAKTSRDPKEEATSSCPPKAPLEEACQKLWRNFRMLPETGKRFQQQLKSHSAPVNLSSLRNAGPPALAHSSGARPGDTHWEDDVSTARFAATSLTSPAQSQDLRDGGDPSGKASRLASGSKVTPRVRSWHRVVMRALSSKASKPETEGLAEAQRDWLPEEYLTPPPFAPGYC
ncbi:hematopoietic SH2 domain-containing protein isoform X3 [Felis catus]|nr:hematopoietic SH2 domain-containing protein isoform X3 [Felis catus]